MPISLIKRSCNSKYGKNGCATMGEAGIAIQERGE
jgi:hypothetical protein